MADPNEEHDARLAQLLDDLQAEFRTHRAVDVAVWQARHPDMADELLALLETLRNLETAIDDWRVQDTPQETTSYPVEPDVVPTQLGRYRILGRVGAGGMGTVYRAEDPRLRRTVAIKVPRFDRLQGSRDTAVRRFLREARAAAPIRHPHVCPIYDVETHDGSPYVVMAFVEGQSLAERLSYSGHPEEPRSAATLARQVALALEAVHAHGVVHRDLKPSNILIDREGQALITDFGLAFSTEDTEPLSVEGAVIGTPAYMSPEQASGAAGQVGPPSDLYSLGVVLYQMLTGRLPFEGPTLAVLARIGSETPPPPSRFRPDLDPALQAIVLRAMARRPEDRYRSAREFAEALEGWLQGIPAMEPQPAADTAVAVKPPPTVVRVDLPNGRPVTVTVDRGTAASGKVAVSWRDEPPTRKRRRRLAIMVTVTFALLLAAGTVVLSTHLQHLSDKSGDPPYPEEAERARRKAARREEFLEPLQKQLAEGQPVTLIGATGGPAWSSWALVEGEAVQAVSPRDNIFEIDAWKGISLLELLSDPQLERYRIRAEVQHNIAPQTHSEVGLYVGDSTQPTRQGTVHSFVSLVFNDGARENDPPRSDVRLRMQVSWKEASGRVPNHEIGLGVSVPFKPHGPPDRSRGWRPLAIEVTPDAVRAFWDGKPIGTATRTGKGARLQQGIDSLPLNPVIPKDIKPSISPRGALGLYGV